MWQSHSIRRADWEYTHLDKQLVVNIDASEDGNEGKRKEERQVEQPSELSTTKIVAKRKFLNCCSYLQACWQKRQLSCFWRFSGQSHFFAFIHFKFVFRQWSCLGATLYSNCFYICSFRLVQWQIRTFCWWKKKKVVYHFVVINSSFSVALYLIGMAHDIEGDELSLSFSSFLKFLSSSSRQMLGILVKAVPD